MKIYNYYKKHWIETRGDEYDDWGSSDWYFETDKTGEILRQIEVYENGNKLKYSKEKLFDDFGGLGDQQLDSLEFENFKISKEEFEKEWMKSNLKKEHQKIIDLISEYLADNYSLRFGQALFNLDINQFKNPENPDKGMRDIHGDKDDKIIERIAARLERFQKQRNK